MQVDFRVGRDLRPQLVEEEREVEPFGLHGLLLPIIALPLFILQLIVARAERKRWKMLVLF